MLPIVYAIQHLRDALARLDGPPDTVTVDRAALAAVLHELENRSARPKTMTQIERDMAGETVTRSRSA